MTNELNYAAVITISLPGADESATVTVTLAPASAVVAGGRVKPLRDCTLADLQEFAGNLEAELWADYQAVRLLELAETTAAVVTVVIVEPNGRQAAGPEAWQDHVVLLPPETQATAEPLAGASEPEIEAPASEARAAPAEEAATGEDIVAAETAPVEEQTVTDPVAPPDADLDVPVDSPLVAPPEEPLPGWPRELRIAGRRRPLSHPTWAAVDILINEPAFRDCQAHALGSLNREVAGVLVGPPPEKQPDGRYVVHVTDSIIARHTRMHGASVTYTPESWRYVTDRLAELYPDESAVMVGWYHTHPGFGIFLSSMDLFIHQNFFTQLWHVALVLDPVARRSGFFCWDRAKTQVKPYDFPWPSWANGSW
jgi:proteasome lid subunit RPN8/RPN11